MMSKIIKFLLILVLLAVIVALVFTMVFFINKDYNINLIDSYEADVNSIDKFDLNLKSTDIEIKESKNEKILVEYYSNTDSDVKIKCEDNNIIVDENETQKNINFSINNSKKVILYVPETYVGDYELKTQSGDINSEIDLSNNNVKVSSSSGDISLYVVSNIDVLTSSGDISVDKINERADIKSSSGDINIGKLNIKEDSSISSSSGDINIGSNESNCYIETKTSSGDVNVNKSDRKSDLVLKITTSSGDIRVD